jgi:hypothetical protein
MPAMIVSHQVRRERMAELIIAAKIFQVGAASPPDRALPLNDRGVDSLLSPPAAVAFIIRASLFRTFRTKEWPDERLFSEHH